MAPTEPRLTVVAWLEVVRRRWLILLLIVGLVALASGYLAVRSYRHRQYVASVQFFVADTSPSSSATQPASQGSTAEPMADFLADDLLDIAHTRAVARTVSAYLAQHGMAQVSAGTVQGSINGSRNDRTITISSTQPAASTALAIVRGMSLALTTWRSQYMGKVAAGRIFVTVVGPPTVARAAVGRPWLSFAERVALGLIVALGVAFAWDSLDDTLHSPGDLERWLEVPVLARVQ